MKNKVLFIIPNFLPGGAEKNLVRVINNLNPELYSISVICLTKDGYNDMLLRPGIDIIDIKSPRIYFSIFKIRNVINIIQPNIVCSWMGYLNAYLAFFIPVFSKKITWVCRESSIASLMIPNQRFPLLFSYFYKKYKRYKTIICQSNFMADDLIKTYKVPADKIVIINNGIDFEEIKNNRHVSKPQQLPAIIKLLFVGGLRKVKRIHLLIEVLEILPQYYNLTIVGNGEEQENIIKLINKKQLTERVEIINECYDPYPYYTQCDVLLLCSEFEGFPNVIVEAFGSGCPAIGYNIQGGANELLANYGGFIVKSNNIQDFAEKIIMVCEKTEIDRKRIIENCKLKFDLSKIIHSYEKLFQIPYS